MTKMISTTRLARLRRSVLALSVPLMLACAGTASAQQRAFPSAEAAMQAFGDALASNDEVALRQLLGADYAKVVPPIGEEVRYSFLSAWARAHHVRSEGDAKAVIAVGADCWTLPMPLVRTAQGWRFDTRAGAEEMRVRRIGRNENAVMQVMGAIVDAQRDYAALDPDRNGLPDYAARFISSPGKRDGLYWPAAPGQPDSPLGAAFEAAARSGDGKGNGEYYGYRYKLLSGQGSHAPGGAYDYTIKGRKLGGFAAVAWPARYGDTGVVTFMISHDGTLVQKDLGTRTTTRAAALTRFDPDASWTPVKQP